MILSIVLNTKMILCSTCNWLYTPHRKHFNRAYFGTLYISTTHLILGVGFLPHGESSLWFRSSRLVMRQRAFGFAKIAWLNKFQQIYWILSGEGWETHQNDFMALFFKYQHCMIQIFKKIDEKWSKFPFFMI